MTAGSGKADGLAEATTPPRTARGRLGEPSLPVVTDALPFNCKTSASAAVAQLVELLGASAPYCGLFCSQVSMEADHWSQLLPLSS